MTARSLLYPLSAEAEGEAWRVLTAQIGGEVAAPLSAALERVSELGRTDRVDLSVLLALRSEIEQARRVGMLCQQLARFALRRARQSQEAVDLAQTLSAVLSHRSPYDGATDIKVQPPPQSIEVLTDPALLFSLLDAVVDWAAGCAQSAVEFAVDRHGRWPGHACLACSFVPEPGATVDSLDWHLLGRIAAAMDLPLERDGGVGSARLRLQMSFPDTVGEHNAGMTARMLHHGDAASLPSRPPAGSHVLVVAAHRDLRLQVRRAIANMGLMVDFVASVEEAVAFCDDGPPHAIVFESALDGERLEHLIVRLRAEQPDVTCVEIVEEGGTFEISGFNGTHRSRLGRDDLRRSLPSTLLFELSKAA